MSNKDNLASSGRGGAGNITSQPKTNPPQEVLDTPVIKSSTYTTGRGGTGNMAKNDPNDPEEARRAQDITPVVRSESGGESHYGRGGAANITKVDKEEAKKAANEAAIIEHDAETKPNEPAKSGGDAATEKAKGWIEKGKQLFKGK